jgi:hypothetical protein
MARLHCSLAVTGTVGSVGTVGNTGEVGSVEVGGSAVGSERELIVIEVVSSMLYQPTVPFCAHL